jgi:hypothetical protein
VASLATSTLPEATALFATVVTDTLPPAPSLDVEAVNVIDDAEFATDCDPIKLSALAPAAALFPVCTDTLPDLNTERPVSAEIEPLCSSDDPDETPREPLDSVPLLPEETTTERPMLV